MPVYKVEVRLNYTTGLPEDCAVNTFHFSDLAGTFDANDVMDDLEDFYNVAHSPGTNPIAYYLSYIVSRVASACEMFVYDIQQPGPPLAYRTWSLGAAQTGQKQLPYEVCLALSYAGNVVGTPSARQRGRIFIGPLMDNAIPGSSAPPFPPSGILNAWVGAGEWLMDQNAIDRSWCVWSRVGQSATPVSHGWVDNELDTQRRRQVKASNRLTWP